ncbi:MAG: UDP-N-acetylmuramoyl-tripeptide--D-alanyl-D-alanine ligase [Pseudomonadota bacterium]
MTLSATATVLQGSLHGKDAEYSGVSTDTRTLVRGDLFVALVGPNFDGHEFVDAAAGKGAIGALVSRHLDAEIASVHVADTRLGLGQLAAHWRRQFQIPVIAVTGSNGKTTVKNMIAAILNVAGPTLATQGNLNNDIGVPLTLLRLRQGDKYAVIEMGMNHPGEIDYLTKLARPTIALINNAAAAHLAGLGSVEAVARAKGEIYAGLAADGIAVINIDDAYADLWRKQAASHRVITFGLEQTADVSAEFELDAGGSTIHLKTPHGGINMRLSLLGRHNVMNALAASSASLAAGVSLADIQAGLEKLKSVSGRLEVRRGLNGARVLDDTYNANPGSLAAGVEVLKAASGERVLVLGDMGELGDAARDIHRRVGLLAKSLGIEHLYAVGELTPDAVEAFGKGAQHFASHEALIENLRASLHGDMTVLVKGSRLMKMERVVAGIVEEDSNGGKA